MYTPWNSGWTETERQPEDRIRSDKGCKKVDNHVESTWVIHFALLEKDGDEFTAKVSVDIDINNEAPGKEKQAEKTANDGLSEIQTLYLVGPVARSADAVVSEPNSLLALSAFGEFNPDSLREASKDDQLFEAFDRAADENSQNVRRLRNRVVGVLSLP